MTASPSIPPSGKSLPSSPWCATAASGRAPPATIKDAVFGLATALRALRAAHLAPAVNLRFLLEGEEEAGSPHLPAYFHAFPLLRRTDAWLVCDGPVHASGRMQVYFGARGIAEVQLTVFGPIHPMHDGHYGNWAPNPIVMLAHLLASMRDENAHVLIPGFYRGVRPLDAADRAALAALPQDDATLARALELGRTEGAPATLAAQISLPALNVRGIQGGAVGARAANAIPTQATASLDFRLVPDQTPDGVRAVVEAFLKRQGYFLVAQPPDAATRLAHPKIVQVNWGPGYPAARVALDAPFSRQVVAAIESALGQSIVKLPIMGGSVPLYLFQGPAHTPVVGVPIANYDDNQHAANENIRLDYLWQGIAVYAALFAGLPAR
ncbi:MAG TPA: M20/M25/M40 family metallo-hydrolase [Terriglobales bacterium]|nr:M20/M25/M40 family metallo-hydrolase [Terriglobales bacterium]